MSATSSELRYPTTSSATSGTNLLVAPPNLLVQRKRFEALGARSARLAFYPAVVHLRTASELDRSALVVVGSHQQVTYSGFVTPASDAHYPPVALHFVTRVKNSFLITTYMRHAFSWNTNDASHLTLAIESPVISASYFADTIGAPRLTASGYGINCALSCAYHQPIDLACFSVVISRPFVQPTDSY